MAQPDFENWNYEKEFGLVGSPQKENPTNNTGLDKFLFNNSNFFQSGSERIILKDTANFKNQKAQTALNKVMYSKTNTFGTKNYDNEALFGNINPFSQFAVEPKVQRSEDNSEQPNQNHNHSSITNRALINLLADSQVVGDYQVNQQKVSRLKIREFGFKDDLNKKLPAFRERQHSGPRDYQFGHQDKLKEKKKQRVTPYYGFYNLNIEDESFVKLRQKGKKEHFKIGAGLKKLKKLNKEIELRNQDFKKSFNNWKRGQIKNGCCPETKQTKHKKKGSSAKVSMRINFKKFKHLCKYCSNDNSLNLKREKMKNRRFHYHHKKKLKKKLCFDKKSCRSTKSIKKCNKLLKKQRSFLLNPSLKQTDMLNNSARFGDAVAKNTIAKTKKKHPNKGIREEEKKSIVGVKANKRSRGKKGNPQELRKGKKRTSSQRLKDFQTSRLVNFRDVVFMKKRKENDDIRKKEKKLFVKIKKKAGEKKQVLNDLIDILQFYSNKDPSLFNLLNHRFNNNKLC